MSKSNYEYRTHTVPVHTIAVEIFQKQKFFDHFDKYFSRLCMYAGTVHFNRTNMYGNWQYQWIDKLFHFVLDGVVGVRHR